MFSMEKAIIIPTHEKFKQWLDNCLKTLTKVNYPIQIVVNTDEDNQYEMRAVRYGMENYKEFIVLQDTFEIKDDKIFDLFFKEPGTVFGNSQGQMFFNKYDSEQLKTIPLPEVNDKLTAVIAESDLHSILMRKFKPKVLLPNFVDNNKREHKFGRENMIIENDLVKKYKGTWSRSMIK